MRTILTPRFLFITIAILLAALSRVLPHPPNFTPIAAMALFGGAFLPNKRLAIFLPLIAMFLSDCLLQLINGTGFHNTMLIVYGCFIATVFMGANLSKNHKVGSVVTYSLISSLVFFFFTNLGTWLFEGNNGAPMYEHNWQGLLNCFTAAIPFYSNSIFGSFFVNTILGDLFFTGALFGSLYFAKSRFPQLAS